MSFEWPWQYSFPPFFTLQPNADTRRKQLAAWCSLVLSYCRHHKIHTLDLLEEEEVAQEGDDGNLLFRNKKMDRGLPTDAARLVLEELRKKGNLEWLDRSKSRCLVLWRRPGEWAALLHRWVCRSGLADCVFTLHDLAHGEHAAGEEFHGLEERTLLRALQALEAQGKAELIAMEEVKGVKFF